MPNSDSSQQKASSLWQNSSLLSLWGGELGSRVGESFFQIALLWYLLEVTESTLATGFVTMISFLPALVVGAWAGVLVDRWEFRRVMLVANLFRASLTLSIPLLFLAGWLPVWLLGLLAFLMTACSAFFNPARDAFIPLLTRQNDLLSANSLVQSAWQLSLLLGPFLAAILLPFFPTVYLFGMVAIAFLLSYLVLLRVPSRPDSKEKDRNLATNALAGFSQEFRQGVAALVRDMRVLAIWIITVFNNFFLMGPVIVGMPVYVKTYLGGTGSDFALVEGTYAGGMILATWIISRHGKGMDPTRMLFWGLIYDGLSYIPLLWVTSVEGTLVAIFIHALGIPAITISRLTALHKIVPHALQGRVFSFFHLAVAGMMALSIGLVGLILTWLPANWLFLWTGIFSASCGVIGLFLPLFRNGLGEGVPVAISPQPK